MSLLGRFIDTSVGRLFVHASGAPSAAEPVVFVHGFLMSHWIWRDALAEIQLLAPQLRLIAIDLPGFGESDRPDPRSFPYDFPALADVLLELCDRLGLERFQLVGHSLGGGVALHAATRAPARVVRQALISPTLLPLPLPLEGQLLKQPILGRLLWNTLFTRNEMRRLMLRDHFRDPAPVTDAFVDYYWARLNRAGGREASYAVLRMLSELRADTHTPEAVRTPTLLVWPDEDRVVPLEHGRTLARRIPGAELRVIPASGHNVQLERPGELARCLAPWLTARAGESTAAKQAEAR